MPRTLNRATLALIKHFEGLYLQAYLCPAGVWTIGYGHTGIRHNDGTVRRGRVITAAEAEQLLSHDMQYFCDGVEELLLKRVREEIHENQFGALVSFAFNCGLGNLRRSTLLQRVNSRRYAECRIEFLKWTRAAGRIKRGLVRRRQSEANLFELKPGPDTDRAMLMPLPAFIVRP